MRRTFWLLLASAGLTVFINAWVILPAAATSAQQTTLTEIKIDPRHFDDFTGQYTFVEDPDFVLSFFREGDKFYVQATNQGRIEIFPASETKFFPKLFDADATFVRDPQGKVTSVLWRQNSRE